MKPSPCHPLASARAFADWLLDKKLRLRLTQREIAQRVNIDEGYVSRIISVPRMPTRPIVEALGIALGDPEGAFRAAGYNVDPAAVQDCSKAIASKLSPLSRDLIDMLAAFPHDQQDAMTLVLRRALVVSKKQASCA